MTLDADTAPLEVAAAAPPAGRGRWTLSLLVLVLGALAVASVVALVVPNAVSDGSGVSARVVAGARITGAHDLALGGADTDVEIARVTFGPGTDGGWHQHGGYSVVTVVQGTATFYGGSQPDCRPTRYSAGAGVLESPHHPSITRNEGAEPLVLYVVTVTPKGKPAASSTPSSPYCHF